MVHLGVDLKSEAYKSLFIKDSLTIDIKPTLIGQK
jgi:hypothetical protein